MHERVEKIESVKAGSLSGIATGIGYSLTIAIDRFILPEQLISLLSLGLAAAIATIGGFLFGIAYRYIIRTDRNDHLNAGAVLAFGLVRGLAQIDVGEFDLSQIWVDGFIVAKSILLFSIARYTLDRALALSWISPFKSP
jgi:hypothetical protein